MLRALPILLLASLTSSSAAAQEGPTAPAAAAVAAGRCADAVSLLEPLLVQDAPPPGAWRVLGDARRCLGEARPAVLAYHRHLAAEGGDPQVEELIETLRQRLGSIRILVRTERPAPVYVLGAPLGEEPVEAVPQPDGSWLIEDLEPGTRPAITIGGTGVLETRDTPPSVPRGGEAELTVAPRWLGIGVLELSSAPPAGVIVEARAAEGWTELPPSSQLRLTAGTVDIAVVGPHGRVETDVTIEADARALFDPAPWLPTGLTVSGAPAGSELRLFMEGVEPPIERTVTLAGTVGDVDEEWGVRIARPIQIDGLVGGPGSLVLSHAHLGLTASELALEPGGVNALEVQWRDLEHSVAVRERYLEWSAERVRVRRATTARVVTGASAGVAGVILSTVGWGVAVQGSLDVRAARDSALADEAHPDGPDGWLNDHEAALRQERGGLALAFTGAGIGAAGVVVAGVFGARGRVEWDRVGPWSPP